MTLSFVNGLSPLLSILCKGLPCVYGDVCSVLYAEDTVMYPLGMATLITKLLVGVAVKYFAVVIVLIIVVTAIL